MKLPIIRSVAEYIEENDAGHVENAVQVLEHVSQARGLKDEELDTIGELISNFCGALEVSEQVKKGADSREALNSFMKRVMGSIDRS